MSLLISKVLGSTLLLPFNLLLLGCLAWILLYTPWANWGKRLLAAMLGLLYLVSTPAFAFYLLSWWEGPPDAQQHPDQAQAIVVLGGGIDRQQLNFPTGNSLSASSLDRIRYAAYLYQQRAMPIVVSGDAGFNAGTSVAQQMAWELEHLFHIPRDDIWLEPQAATTQENATYSYQLLKPYGLTHILLVTQAWHMPRSVAAFKQAGFQVVPTPSTWASPPKPNIRAWLPDSDSLLLSNRVLHESIGLVWYRLRFFTD